MLVQEVRAMASSEGWALWLTGLPAAGKTALARALWRRLVDLGVAVVVLDSDEVRPILTPTPTYSAGERDRFYHGLVDLAALLARYGVNVLIAATGNRRAYRQAARDQLARFAEVWVRCPLAVCQARDPKGLYARAAGGAIRGLPGIDAPYEPPGHPEVVVDTDRHSVDEAVDQILASIPFLKRGIEL
jgi:adenylylsulfate kinase